MRAVILAGGSGTRLWPASTDQFPKQFLDICGDGPLLLQTLHRCVQIGAGDHCYVITRNAYEAQVTSLMHQFNPTLQNNIILEPIARNTAPAILLAAKFLEYEAGAGLDEVMLVLPSDHQIEQDDKLPYYFSLGETQAKGGHIVIFGVVPDKPETGFGYIKAKSKPINNENASLGWLLQALPVSAFTEKPNLALAESYLAEGGYFWNAGMFALTLRTLYSELEKHLPEIAPFLTLDYQTLLQKFDQLPKISFDFAVMEKTDRAVVIPLAVNWSDVGSWDSIYESLPKDMHGNALQGNVLCSETTHSLLINKTDAPMIITGLNNAIVVQTYEGMLSMKLGESQKIGNLVSLMNQQATQAPLIK